MTKSPANKITLNKFLPFVFTLLFGLNFTTATDAQTVSVSDDSAYVANSSAILDVKSTSKGMLVPRVSLTGTTSASPVTNPATSLIVYNEATVSDVTPGFYYWNATKWERIANGEGSINIVTKTVNDTITKTETMVMASNDITLTLPAITSTDNGLAISIKNTGTYTDLITIITSGSSTIDNASITTLTRWQGQTYLAEDGNWQVKEKTPRACNILDVSSRSSWTTIDEILAFLNEHMNKPVIIRLCEPVFEITSTQIIDLPYPVTFQGLSFGETTIAAASGLEGNPMFRCLSECYFKMLMFDATTLSGYGTNAGDDCIRLSGSGTYHEIKDCTFDGFYNTIVDSTDAELWLFECDISNAHNNGVLLNSTISGVKLRVSETDFISCIKGINLEKGSNANIQLCSGAYLNANPTDIGINYVAADFTTFETMIITNNSWNNVGTFISGFDFTRTDGRDSKAFIISNAGMGDQNPKCKINVRNNTLVTNIANSSTWYKASWTNTSVLTCMWTALNNKLTYQPTNKRNVLITITGNLSVNNNNRTISIGFVKNGVTTTRYGECDLRVTAANQPFQFSTVVYIENVSANDYFELYCTSSSSNDNVIFQDIQWFTDTK